MAGRGAGPEVEAQRWEAEGRALGSVDTGKVRRAPGSEENLSSGLVAGDLLLSRESIFYTHFPLRFQRQW